MCFGKAFTCFQFDDNFVFYNDIGKELPDDFVTIENVQRSLFLRTKSRTSKFN